MKIIIAICLIGKLIYSSEICSICQDTEENEDLYHKTSCGHEFHQNCIHNWMKQKSSCPMCRKLISRAEKELVEENVRFTQQLGFTEKQDVDLDAKLRRVVAIDVMNKTMETIRDKAITILVSQGADVNKTGYIGETALHYAVRNDDESLAKIFLQNGADPNSINNSGDTALHYTARNRNESLAKILLKNGADPRKTNKSGKTALHYALTFANEPLAKIIFIQQLAFAEKQGVSLDMKLRNVVAIDVMNFKMMEAIRDKAITRLVSQGANVNKTGTGETALHYAVRNANESLAKILLKNGADPNAINTSGDTTFHYAVKNANESLVKILLKNRADPNMINSSGETALHSSARNANESLVKILLEKGADTDAIDTSGDTPLMQAAKSAQPKTMKLLLDAGARRDTMNKINHKTALTYLQEKESAVKQSDGELHGLKMNFSKKKEKYSQRGKVIQFKSKFIGVIYDQNTLQWRGKRWNKKEHVPHETEGYEDEKEAAYASDTLARKLAAYGEKGHELNFLGKDTQNLNRAKKEKTLQILWRNLRRK